MNAKTQHQMMVMRKMVATLRLGTGVSWGVGTGVGIDGAFVGTREGAVVGSPTGAFDIVGRTVGFIVVGFEVEIVGFEVGLRVGTG